MVTYYRAVTDDDRVFKALADPTRRFLLDRLFMRDGRTLTELESELEMTRFGVMKHLRVLEDAGLVVTRRSGREKLHFLNPVPIRLIHDRWIDKYTERQVSALADLKTQLEEDCMTTATERLTTQVYRVYIKATPEAIWDAITKPEWTAKYGYRGTPSTTCGPAASTAARANEAMQAMGMPELVVDGEVWRPIRRASSSKRGARSGTPEIEGGGAHAPHLGHRGGRRGRHEAHRDARAGERADARPTRSPATARSTQGGGGWSWILSDLKTLLESGENPGQ